MAAQALIQRVPEPNQAQVEDALAGVLYRCTGYAKIVDAVMDVAESGAAAMPAAGKAVGAAVERLDGGPNVLGSEVFGADLVPVGALGVELNAFTLIGGDTALTPDCGKTSASRQTYITGKAAELAGRALRQRILSLAGMGEEARIAMNNNGLVVIDATKKQPVDLTSLAPNQQGYVLMAEETYDPATTALDENGQGTPYAVYGYGAQIAENCEPALCTVMFMRGAGDSLRSGVTRNPVQLTRSVQAFKTAVTCGGCPAYVWPGGGITVMVDVRDMPEGSFGYVPTPAIVAPLEFTLTREDYTALGGHEAAIRDLREVLQHGGQFVTPMAAAAGAVADEILAAMRGVGRRKAYVNNGGDISVFIEENNEFTGAIPHLGQARIRLADRDPWRGVASSGHGGRSHSLGIADCVTVAAITAAAADAAATLIANAVNLPDHPVVKRQPASDHSPDSDLGDRLVTVCVGVLAPEDIKRALRRGTGFAGNLLARRRALLALQGRVSCVGSAGLELNKLGEIEYV